MVRAIPVNQWWRADFLERIRPGFALSAALHVGLLTALAYYLAFHPPVLAPPEEQGPVLTMIPPPAPPPKPQPPVKTSVFQPTETPALAEVHTAVGPLQLPPVEIFERPQTTTPQTQPPAQRVVTNPEPIYRGGLVYPDRAVEDDVSGYVDFNFIIEPDGSVGDPQVTAEVPDGYGFAASAKKAFPHWRFKPQLVDGKPVAAPARIRVTFKLN
jgi:protein TonB